MSNVYLVVRAMEELEELYQKAYEDSEEYKWILRMMMHKIDEIKQLAEAGWY